MENLCEGTAPFLSIFPIDRFRGSPRFPDRRFVGFGDAAWFILNQFSRLFRFRGSAETRPRGGREGCARANAKANARVNPVSIVSVIGFSSLSSWDSPSVVIHSFSFTHLIPNASKDGYACGDDDASSADGVWERLQEG